MLLKILPKNLPIKLWQIPGGSDYHDSQLPSLSHKITSEAYRGRMIWSVRGDVALGLGQAVQHCWCNTLLISTMLGKEKDVVGEKNSVASTQFETSLRLF